MFYDSLITVLFCFVLGGFCSDVIVWKEWWYWMCEVVCGVWLVGVWLFVPKWRLLSIV